MASTLSIGNAIKAIPEKKADLRKSLEDLRSLSSSLSSFLLRWDDLDAHLSSVQSSIALRFEKLQSLEKANTITKTTAKTETKPASATSSPSPPPVPRPELLSLCTKMDAPGLRHFMGENRGNFDSIRPELVSAIRSAPDPARLILETTRVFYPADIRGGPTNSSQHFTKRTCILLLEQMCIIRPEISADVAADAKKLADEWKGKATSDGAGDHSLQAWGFLQLVAAFNLAPEFDINDILEVITVFSKRGPAANVVKALGISEHMPTLIEKLISKGKQCDAVKFVYAFDLLEKYPPVPLLKEYVKEAKKVAQEVRKKGNNSAQARNEATAKEIAFLSSVIKAIEEYKLESEYPSEPLRKQVEKLEKMKTEKKRPMVTAARYLQHQPENANKRPRAAFGGPPAAAAAYPAIPLLSNQSQPFMADRGSYLGAGGLYGVPGGSRFNHSGFGFLEPPQVPGSTSSPPKSYIFPSASGLYERSIAHERPPASYNSQAAYDRPSAYDSFGKYTLSGGLP